MGACRECSVGKFTDEPGQTKCKSCDPGEVTQGTGQMLCSECLPGTTNLVFSTSSNTFEYSATTCTPAPVGFYVDQLTRTITPCPSGTFNDQPGGKSREKMGIQPYTSVHIGTERELETDKGNVRGLTRRCVLLLPPCLCTRYGQPRAASPARPATLAMLDRSHAQDAHPEERYASRGGLSFLTGFGAKTLQDQGSLATRCSILVRCRRHALPKVT